MNSNIINNTTIVNTFSLKAKMQDYNQLVKLRLTLLVVFSSIITYLTASTGNINWFEVAMLALGGFLVTGSSNGINQIIEKDYDKLMHRTANRPIATNRMSVNEATIACLIFGVSGVFIISFYLNQISGILAFAALVSYAFIYTPLKRVSPISVFVGAFPGAIPTMLGWVAFTGKIDAPAVALFMVQFLWQFPHFWSIAWILDDDYKRAGFKMLPSTPGRDKKTALQTIAYSLVTIPVGILPYHLGVSGIVSAIVAILAGCMLCYYSWILFKNCDNAAAKKLMFASFVYLPVVQITYYLDKI